MTFMQFESFEEMQAFMARQTEEANRTLAIPQAALTFGSTWARFDHLQQFGCIFGKVYTLEQWEKAERDAGATEVEARAEREMLIANHDRGYLYGQAFSVIERNGEWGDTHRANAWPIEEVTFEAAREAGWDIERMETAQALNLSIAYQQWLAHVRSLGL